MKKMNSSVLFTALAVTTMTFAGIAAAGSCGSSNTSTKASHEHQAPKNIVETAAAAGGFETLIAAAKAAGLAETLMGEGPFTVFAPTDEAFAKLPEGTVAMLLKPENKSKLQAILTYHVVPGKVTSADVVNLKSATTVQGQKLGIRVNEGNVMIDDSLVTAVDIETSNGVIHVIDTVLMPKM